MLVQVKQWIQANGGPEASAIAALISFNIIMTGLKSLCDKLKIQEPVWLQKMGSLGSAVLGLLTANTAAPAPKTADPQSDRAA